MDDESREVLESFVEKAVKLIDMKYTRQIVEQQGILQVKLGENEPWRISTGDDERDAFIATLRMFMQKKDRISFHHVAGLLDNSGLSSDWKNEFSQARSTWNQILDGCLPHLMVNGQPLKRRDMWDVIVHGDLAHVDKRKKATLNQWRSDPALYAQVEFEFHTMIVFMLDQIGRVALASRRELERNVI